MMLAHTLRKRWFWLVLMVLIACFTSFCIAYALRTAPPFDSSAMVIQGKSLVQGHGIQYYDANNLQIGPYFNPMGFDVRAPLDPQPYSVFPPGLSLVIALIYGLTGSLNYLYLIPPIASMLGLVAAAYLGYALSGKWGSIFAVILIGTSYVVIDLSTTLLSDGPSLSILLVSLALYWFAFTSGKKTPAILAGLCLGFYVLFKFVNVVFAMLIVAHALFTADGRKRGAMVALLSPGILLGITGMLVYQAQAYGGPLTNAFQAWGNNRFSFPLFSLQYLFVQSPAPWNDFSLDAIVTGLLKDMHIWILFFLTGLMIDRKNPLRLLLAFVVLLNILIYAVSVFTPRQNMRYMLPALATGYIIVADVLARLMSQLNNRIPRTILVSLVCIICLGKLGGSLPAFTGRNAGATSMVEAAIGMRQVLPSNAVVLAYLTADTLILYDDLSVLNYRKVTASDLAMRNEIVVQAIKQLQARKQPVYLIKDDDRLFNTIYLELQKDFILKPVDAPLTAYEIKLPQERSTPTTGE